MTDATTKPWAVIQDQYCNESIVDSIGDYVVEMAEQTIDAHEIVKAVNNHDALVAALEAAKTLFYNVPASSITDKNVKGATVKKMIEAALVNNSPRRAN